MLSLQGNCRARQGSGHKSLIRSVKRYSVQKQFRLSANRAYDVCKGLRYVVRVAHMVDNPALDPHPISAHSSPESNRHR
jgi:hypothetical protein